MNSGMSAGIRTAGVLWAIGGIAALLMYAAASLGKHTVVAIGTGLTSIEWAALIANAVFMGWAEGYRGFQKRFSPRVAARALNLHENPTPLRLLLAPLFCIGYFGATPRLRLTIWIGTGLIVLAVLLFNRIAQPWRGILDGGVMVGLTWGTISLLHAAWTTFRVRQPLVAPEVPAPAGV